MFVLFAIYLAKKMRLIKGDIVDKHNFVEMERAQQVLSGGISGMVQTVRDNSPNFTGSALDQLSMIQHTAAGIGRGFSQELNQSVWNVREQGVMQTLNRIGKLKRRADYNKAI